MGMIKRFKGQLAVVTGGTSGIGAGIARMLVSEGATCVLFARNRNRMNDLQLHEDANLKRQFFYKVDVTSQEEVTDAVNEVIRRFGQVYLLVNAAGINVRKPALDYRLDEWKQIVDTNLTGSFLVSQSLARHMKDHGGGSILNIGSMLSHYGVPNVAPYAASKGGMAQLTKALAVEWAPIDIRVNQISPGYVLTALSQNVLCEGPYRDRIIRRTPLRRLGTVNDVAKAAAFLLSSDASFITGQILCVDGGIDGGDPTLDPLLDEEHE